MYRSINVLIAAAVLSIPNIAIASDLSCSAWMTFVNRWVGFNVGAYGTKGPAVVAIPECIDKKSGFYGGAVAIVPTEDFRTGGEGDLRLGNRFNFNGLDADISVADYYFGVGAGPTWNILNGRMKISRLFSLGGIEVRPYVIGDLQHSFNLHANAVAVGPGVTVNGKLTFVPGKPILEIDASDWYLTHAFSPGRGPIRNVDMSVGWQVSKNVVFGPRVRWTAGDVSNPSDHTIKTTGGIYTFITY